MQYICLFSSDCLAAIVGLFGLPSGEWESQVAGCNSADFPPTIDIPLMMGHRLTQPRLLCYRMFHEPCRKRDRHFPVVPRSAAQVPRPLSLSPHRFLVAWFVSQQHLFKYFLHLTFAISPTKKPRDFRFIATHYNEFSPPTMCHKRDGVCAAGTVTHEFSAVQRIFDPTYRKCHRPGTQDRWWSRVWVEG